MHYCSDFNIYSNRIIFTRKWRFLNNEYGLSKDETYFLLALLQKRSWKEYIKDHHLMPSILADGINDKLFDEIGDAVIEFNDNNEPEIVADYYPDLKEMFLGGEN